MCDRKFFIRDLVEDKNLQIEAQTNQLLGTEGLNTQIETKLDEIRKIRQEYDKDRKIYSLDYLKMQKIKDEKK